MKLNQLVVGIEELQGVKEACRRVGMLTPLFIDALLREMEYQNATALYYKLEAIDCKE
jgi:hypothetical protein